MKISKLVKQLQQIQAQYGDNPVMFQDPNSDGGPFEVGAVSYAEAEDGEFPKSFKMPAGFKYVVLDN